MWHRAVIAGALLLAGCGPDDASTAVGAAEPVRWLADGAPDELVGGPQGGEGQFAVECSFSHVAPDDPIVHPGHAGFSHLHQFFGAKGVGASTVHRDLEVAETTCDQQLDKASYWSPTLVDSTGESIEADRLVAYYRAGVGVNPMTVEPFPPGLMMVAGDQDALEPQSLTTVSWSCGATLDRFDSPIECDESGVLRLNVVFPDCWNGTTISALPGAAHVAYSSGGRCPAGFGTAIPQLHLAFDFPAVDPKGLALSSGPVEGAHADFWNAWDPAKLEREVRQCINRNLPCSVVN